jgi:hypothetical protein
MRGPSLERGAAAEEAGVGKAGSAGRREVKTEDLGRSLRVTPDVAAEAVELIL